VSPWSTKITVDHFYTTCLTLEAEHHLHSSTTQCSIVSIPLSVVEYMDCLSIPPTPLMNQEHHPLISIYPDSMVIPLNPDTLNIPRGFAIISSLAQIIIHSTTITHYQLSIAPYHTILHYTSLGQYWTPFSTPLKPPKLRCIYNHQRHQQQQHLALVVNFH
jgi:hypothetical protein